MVSVSTDEGQTWSHHKQVHDGPSGYSDLVVLPNRTIGLLHDKDTHVAFARFNFEWLKQPCLSLADFKDGRRHLSVPTKMSIFSPQGGSCGETSAARGAVCSARVVDAAAQTAATAGPHVLGGLVRLRRTSSGSFASARCAKPSPTRRRCRARQSPPAAAARSTACSTSSPVPHRAPASSSTRGSSTWPGRPRVRPLPCWCWTIHRSPAMGRRSKVSAGPPLAGWHHTPKGLVRGWCVVTAMLKVGSCQLRAFRC